MADKNVIFEPFSTNGSPTQIKLTKSGKCLTANGATLSHGRCHSCGGPCTWRFALRALAKCYGVWKHPGALI